MTEFLPLALPAAMVTIVSYLLGSISSSILFTRLFDHQKDIRTLGSGNAGLTNVLRCVGIKVGVLTFLLDSSKGILSVLIGRLVFQWVCTQNHLPEYLIQYGAFLAGIACVVGHIYPLYFHFQGGKGVLSSAAIIAFLDWRYFLIAILIFALVFSLTKIVSISSVCGALSFPIINFVFSFFAFQSGAVPFSYVWVTTAFACFYAALLVYKHRTNLERLKNGTEQKFTLKHS